MTRFSANLSMLWTDRAPLERFECAAAAGFTHVEMLFPQMLPPQNLERTLNTTGLQLALFDFNAGDWEAGERGIAALAERVEEFRSHWSDELELASRLGTRTMTVLAGVRPEGIDPADCDRVLVDNLHALGRLADPFGVIVTVEAINGNDVPGFHVRTVSHAAALVSQVGLDNVKIQFDQYHVVRESEDPIVQFERYFSQIGHVQIADIPGRHEPGTGTAQIAQFLDRLDQLGYEGRVGLEYIPKTDTETALAWLPRTARSG